MDWLEGWGRIVALPVPPAVMPVLAAIALLLLVTSLALWVKLARTRRRLSVALSPEHALFQTIVAARQVRAAMGRPVALSSPASKTRLDAVAADAGATGERHPLHLKIYVDCSNLYIDWSKLDKGGVDWDLFPRLVMEAIAARPEYKDRVISYRGCNVYGSYFEEAYYDLLGRLNNGTVKKAPVAFRPFKKSRVSSANAVLVSGAAASISPTATPTPIQAPALDAADKAMAADIERWRGENAAMRDTLIRGLNRKLGYSTFAVQRRTPQSLVSASYTSDGVPIAAEKQVDTRFCTELIADAVYDIYDVAVVVSADEDFVPAIDFVTQELGRHVIQLGHRNFSRAIREHATGHIDLQAIVESVTATRGPSVAANG